MKKTILMVALLVACAASLTAQNSRNTPDRRFFFVKGPVVEFTEVVDNGEPQVVKFNGRGELTSAMVLDYSVPERDAQGQIVKFCAKEANDMDGEIYCTGFVWTDDGHLWKELMETPEGDAVKVYTLDGQHFPKTAVTTGFLGDDVNWKTIYSYASQDVDNYGNITQWVEKEYDGGQLIATSTHVRRFRYNGSTEDELPRSVRQTTTVSTVATPQAPAAETLVPGQGQPVVTQSNPTPDPSQPASVSVQQLVRQQSVQTSGSVQTTLPEFPGGATELNKYFKENLSYPKEARQAKAAGQTVVEFFIEKDGSVSNARVLQSVHPALDEEALRVINAMPRWQPATDKDGQPVRTRFQMPFSFGPKQ